MTSVQKEAIVSDVQFSKLSAPLSLRSLRGVHKGGEQAQGALQLQGGLPPGKLSPSTRSWGGAQQCLEALWVTLGSVSDRYIEN